MKLDGKRVLISEEECFRTVERDGYYVICPILPELRLDHIETPALTAEYSSKDVTIDIPGLVALLRKTEVISS